MNNPAASCGVSNTQTKKSLVASHGELNPERLKSTVARKSPLKFPQGNKNGRSGVPTVGISLKQAGYQVILPFQGLIPAATGEANPSNCGASAAVRIKL